MQPAELLDRVLVRVQQMNEVGWVVEQPPGAALTLHHNSDIVARNFVRLQLEHIETFVDVDKSHQNCCGTRHTLQAALNTIADAHALDDVSSRLAAARLFSRAAAEQQQSSRAKAATRHLVYRDRPPPVLRHTTTDNGVRCCLCLAPTLTLQRDMSVPLHSQTGDSPKQMVPLFLGVRVDNATVPFITPGGSHEGLHRASHVRGDARVSVCLLPLTALQTDPVGHSVAVYAPVEYWLSGQSRGVASAAGDKRRRHSLPSDVGRPSTHQDAVPIGFEFLLPVLHDGTNGWAAMSDAVVHLESYVPHATIAPRYTLSGYVDCAGTDATGAPRPDSRRTREGERHKQVALRRRHDHLLNVFVSLGAGPGSTQNTEKSTLVLSGCDAAHRFTVAEHDAVFFQRLATLRTSAPILVETCAVGGATVLSAALPSGVFSEGRPPASGSALTPVHSLLDFANALQDK